MDQHSREKKLRLDIVCNSQRVQDFGFLSLVKVIRYQISASKCQSAVCSHYHES